jgi:hypothetical protein
VATAAAEELKQCIEQRGLSAAVEELVAACEALEEQEQ